MPSITEQIDHAYKTMSPTELEAFFKDLREQMHSEHGRISSEYVTACNELGTFFRGRARYAEGEEAYLDALDCIEALVGRTDSYATCLDNLGELYRLWGDFDKCEKFLKAAEDTFSSKESVDYAACLNYQGHLAEARRDYEKAKELYLHSLAIIEAACPGSGTYATGCQNVANAFQALGDLHSATAYVDKAVALYQERSLPKGAHYVSLLNQMAALQVAQGKCEEAEASFDRAVDAIATTAVSPLDAIVVLVNAASLYRKRGSEAKLAAVLPRIEELARITSIQGNPLVERIKGLIASWR